MFQNIIEVLILSAIQGISEFLPISSSAHLILVSSLYEFKSSSLLIDISLHLGSLFAIVYYFKEELLNINKNKRLISLIVIGSIPLIIFGYFLYTTGLIYSLRNIETIAWTTLIFAIVLYISDKSRFDKKNFYKFKYSINSIYRNDANFIIDTWSKQSRYYNNSCKDFEI